MILVDGLLAVPPLWSSAVALGPAKSDWEQEQEREQVARTRFIAYGVVAPITVAVGIVGNLLTIVLLRQPQFRGVTFTYFLVLALSDLISLCMFVSMMVHFQHEETLSFSTAVWYAYFELFMVNVPMSVSVLVVVCITVDRFYSVCRPTHFAAIHTERCARLAIAGSVAFAVLVWLPVCFLLHPVECVELSCSPPDNRTWWAVRFNNELFPEDWYRPYAWVRQVLLAFIPIILLVVLNALTLRGFLRLRARRAEMARSSASGSLQLTVSSSAEGRHRKEQHLIPLLVAVMITFSATMLPSGIVDAIHTDDPEDEATYEVFRALGNNLEVLSHALNFYMYILCSRTIRVALKNIFRRRRQVSLARASVSRVLIAVQQLTRNDGRGKTPSAEPTGTEEGRRREKETQGVAAETASERDLAQTV
ncbi:probable G-protein coupled receptor AH9.1 [Penaeus chinensis]|uniref:probable G-protein coupled receptor AH9.1 n=1 Tax=Penaeus chinensis TaxID=139456 RepID=UPI001FB67978|nr:probable G-protein coupled receptor AH9.1 [Penaeus chinensis]XP_047496085.1 probable G-protein coupled receptor AH9.1 [Penaeus chinensis]XP_047496086.1 probable G-protein coupled receptor AH9.1 [Penaeus chinensis]XP_047496087.1 probable G-protein coupled receptor AH9.1 [Penaeus chinensis]XP_047496088.1 probable G-protein coupled receptor AH9.1 [Penaeus chinensis]